MTERAFRQGVKYGEGEVPPPRCAKKPPGWASEGRASRRNSGTAERQRRRAGAGGRQRRCIRRCVFGVVYWGLGRPVGPIYSRVGEAWLALKTAGISFCDSGGAGIRTLETLAGLPVFKTGAIDHSATPPGVVLKCIRPVIAGQNHRFPRRK